MKKYGKSLVMTRILLMLSVGACLVCPHDAHAAPWGRVLKGAKSVWKAVGKAVGVGGAARSEARAAAESGERSWVSYVDDGYAIYKKVSRDDSDDRPVRRKSKSKRWIWIASGAGVLILFGIFGGKGKR